MNNKNAVDIYPQFGLGQTEGAEEYIAQAIPQLCARLNMTRENTKELLSLGLASCRACSSVMSKVLNEGMVEPIQEARAFWRCIIDCFVDTSSELIGASNLEAAMAHLRDGGNVLMVQNHRSGADTLVWEALANRYYGYDIAQDWAYMSGHAVNLYLLPFMFTAAMRRFQIFSVKYQSIGLPGIACEQQMNEQNRRALRSLILYAKDGGKLFGLYPEGGRGDSAMIRGEAKTMCIGLAIEKAGPELMVLPTYVDGSTNILPVTRTSNEYNEVFINARKGRADLTVGRPVMWQDLFSHKSVGAGRSEQERRALCDIVLSLVGALAPSSNQAGPYADPVMRDQIANWV